MSDEYIEESLIKVENATARYLICISFVCKLNLFTKLSQLLGIT